MSDRFRPPTQDCLLLGRNKAWRPFKGQEWHPWFSLGKALAGNSGSDATTVTIPIAALVAITIASATASRKTSTSNSTRTGKSRSMSNMAAMVVNQEQ